MLGWFRSYRPEANRWFYADLQTLLKNERNALKCLRAFRASANSHSHQIDAFLELDKNGSALSNALNISGKLGTMSRDRLPLESHIASVDLHWLINIALTFAPEDEAVTRIVDIPDFGPLLSSLQGDLSILMLLEDEESPMKRQAYFSGRKR